MMKCVACQAEIEAKSVYCPKCGAKIDEPEAPETSEENGAEVTQQPADAETEPATEPEEDRTASERLLDVAKAANEQAADTDSPSEWTEGGYSPKALNARFLVISVASVLLLVLSLWLMWSKEWSAPLALYPSLAVIAALWIWFACIRVYRVGTIKYQLTAHQFYHEEGIFKRIRDVIEVIDIDDLKLERTLWDRMINGGVGCVTIKSTDTSSPVLKLPGLDDPDVVFRALDEARRKERVARGLKSV